MGSVFVYLLCHGFALTVTRKKREQRRRAKGNEQGERGAEKLAKQQAAMVTMMRKKKKFVGNGNGFTWSQLPGFSLSHSHTPIPLPSFSLYLRLFVHVSVACCAFCVSLCAAQLLTVSAFATTMRHAKMSRSLTRQAQFINGTSSPFSLSPLPRCLWLKNKKKVLSAVSVQLSNWRRFYRLVVALILIPILILYSRCRCVFAAVATIYKITLAMPVRNFPKYIHTHTQRKKEKKQKQRVWESEINMWVYLY